ncbi:ArnT family glycosyltransferase [Halomonas sp. IOP_31]|uniref:ArnT family glycosyltransferase n=1 Tax=Halomonas sp. IOP_31 TaxID=2876584 RepID=UPI001E40ED78|nr:glycosyltransferase family 39 protein [Halomonas sp. IOP_31]MCD6007542.1 glycosyltransferase family 39 protein [Halomonas sp. IOP_31]
MLRTLSTRLSSWPGIGTWQSGLLLTLIIAVVAVVIRVNYLPLMPIDETRYLSVAWEMWQNNSFLVPHLNGEPYPDKPPLLFWLIQSAWALFGTSDVVARLAIPAVGLLTFPLLVAIQREWPEQQAPGMRWAPPVLLAMTMWFVYMPLSMFDILQTTCLLIATLGWVRYVHRAERRWLVLAGFGLGLALLAKGPVVLIYWLPLTLSTRFWRPDGVTIGARHYWAILPATLLGAAVVLAWAIPAAITGSPEYAQAIFWGQSAGRVTNAFAHARPWYWYLPLLPLLTLPWPTVWLWRRPLASGSLERFALWGCLPPLVILSLVSGKQVHYLMPALPFLAIWVAGQIERHPPRRTWLYRLLLLVLAGLMLALPEIALRFYPLAPLPNAVRLTALVPLALIVGLSLHPRRVIMTLAWPLSLLALLIGLSPALARYYDVTPFAREIGYQQQQGVPVAYVGDYANQFRFLGRLTQDMTVIDSDEVIAWSADHPQGALIEVVDTLSPAQRAGALFSQPYRGSFLVLMPSARHGLLDR